MVPRDDADGRGVPRRSVLRGAGGIAAIPLSGVSFAEARGSGALEGVQTDPHTRDVFRAIVDAIVPRTPDLVEELGAAAEPGALDVELEKFLVWDFDHFHEIRAETVASASPARIEAAFDPGAVTDLLDLGDLGDLGGLGGVTESAVDFGDLERFAVTVDEVPAEGPVDLSVAVETAHDQFHRVMQNYPYAEALATAFELVAIEFVARGRNERQPIPANERFPAGGLFVRLHPRDRLRCLETIIDGSVVDRLDDALGALVPTVGVLKFAVMGVFGLATLGYYSEWPGYGDTKTDTPNERTLRTAQAEIVGHEQTGYPGPAPGYAAHRGFAVESYRENDWGDGE